MQESNTSTSMSRNEEEIKIQISNKPQIRKSVIPEKMRER